MDHSSHTPLRAEEINAENITDAPIYGPEDNNIGTVAHMHGSDHNARVIIDVGGFLGLGAKPVALPVSALNFMRDESGTVHATTTMTKEQLKDLPEHTH